MQGLNSKASMSTQALADPQKHKAQGTYMMRLCPHQPFPTFQLYLALGWLSLGLRERSAGGAGGKSGHITLHAQKLFHGTHWGREGFRYSNLRLVV